MRSLNPALLAVSLALTGACVAASASADEPHAADVTITVVEDPEQLKDKVNKIRLPDAEQDAHAAQKPSASRDKRAQDSDGAPPSGDRHEQDRAEARKPDGDDARQHSAEAREVRPHP